MALIKCTECEQMISEKASECPNCGCPVADMVFDDENNTKSEKLEDSMDGLSEEPHQTEDIEKTEDTENVCFPTTDTGTSDEETIMTFADLFLYISMFLGFFGIIICLALIDITNGMSAYGILYIAIHVLLVYVFRAFIRVFHNISINLHEINMKLK